MTFVAFLLKNPSLVSDYIILSFEFQSHFTFKSGQDSHRLMSWSFFPSVRRTKNQYCRISIPIKQIFSTFQSLIQHKTFSYKQKSYINLGFTYNKQIDVLWTKNIIIMNQINKRIFRNFITSIMWPLYAMDTESILRRPSIHFLCDRWKYIVSFSFSLSLLFRWDILLSTRVCFLLSLLAKFFFMVLASDVFSLYLAVSSPWRANLWVLQHTAL